MGERRANRVNGMGLYRYAGVMPFIGIQLVALAALYAFADLVTWLSNAIGG